jgi:hypothetical protein
VKSAATALFLVLLISQSISAEGGEGTVCVAPNSAEPPQRFSPGLEYNPATLSLKIDQRQPIPWPHKDSFKIDGLDLKERHLVVLTSNGKRLQSFWFRFSEFNSVDLCIAFDGYGGPELREAKGSPWCKCK